MAKSNINIQDGFLFQNLKAGNSVSLQLVTGAEMHGVLKRFDRFALVLESPPGRETLVYKHAIAAISETVAAG